MPPKTKYEGGIEELRGTVTANQGSHDSNLEMRL